MSHLRLARNAAALGAGLLFGFGLTLSGMTQPSKVVGFLDVSGDWDPSLALVMAGAIAVHAPFARRALRPEARPLFAGTFDYRRSGGVDRRLLAGAALFGVGWGLSGYCPGPAIASLAMASLPTAAFVAAMVLGMLGVKLALRSHAERDARQRDEQLLVE